MSSKAIGAHEEQHGRNELSSSSGNMFLMLTSVLKRSSLNIVPCVSSSTMSISDDSITTTNWQEMGIFEKVTVLRTLCDARLDKADLDQVTEV